MKKTLFSVLALTTVISSCATSKRQTSLHGKLSGVESDTILIFSSDPTATRGEKTRIDTIALEEGKFNFTLKDSTLMRVQIQPKPSGNGAMRMSGANSTVFIAPGDQLTIKGAVDGFTVTGNKLYEAMNAQTKINGFNSELEKIQAEYMDLYKKGALTDSAKMSIQSRRSSALDSMTNAQYAYIMANPNSELSAFFLTTIPVTRVDSAYKSLSESVKSSAYAPLIEVRMKQYEDFVAKEEAKAKLNPGMPAPGFSLPNLKGETVTLEQFRGKYVVLDFWGTWCGWCIKGLPEMKAYYQKYKNKMEIIGIDCRDKEDKWREGVAEHQIPWVNVYNGFERKIINDYAIAGFPTKAIIDPQGNIVKIVIGESPEFYELIDQLMAKK